MVFTLNLTIEKHETPRSSKLTFGKEQVKKYSSFSTCEQRLENRKSPKHVSL
jgi:hypothetical protein